MAFDEDFQQASRESLNFLTKAFRGSVDLTEVSNRSLLGAATATIGAYTRLQQTASAREQTRFAMALALSRESDDLTVSDAMKLTMPEHRALKRLNAA